jgi:MFS family permease
MGLLYTFGVALFAAIGTFLFGFDTGIATTTIAHESWVDYMHKPSKGLTGAVVAIYIAGEACGALFQTALGDKLGRIRFMQLMCIIVTIGTAVQTGSINLGMFLAGRGIAGFAVGGMVGTGKYTISSQPFSAKFRAFDQHTLSLTFIETILGRWCHSPSHTHVPLATSICIFRYRF